MIFYVQKLSENRFHKCELPLFVSATTFKYCLGDNGSLNAKIGDFVDQT